MSVRTIRLVIASALATALVIPGGGMAVADAGHTRSGSAVPTSEVDLAVTAALSKAARAATTHAENVGGYTWTSEWLWDDGAAIREVWNFRSDGSVKFSGTEEYPDGSSSTDGFILDRKTETYSWRPGGSEETRRAWGLLKAHPDAWIVKKWTGRINKPTMKNKGGRAGVPISHWGVPLYDDVYKSDYKVLSGDVTSSGLITARLLHSSGHELTLTVTVDDQGLPTELAVKPLEPGNYVPWSFIARWQYEAPVIEQLTGRLAVKSILFKRAVQSFTMRNKLWGLAVVTRSDARSKTPQGLREWAEWELHHMRTNGFRMNVKLIPIRFGVRIQARNPFTKELFRWDVEVRPGSEPTLKDRSPRRLLRQGRGRPPFRH